MYADIHWRVQGPGNQHFNALPLLSVLSSSMNTLSIRSCLNCVSWLKNILKILDILWLIREWFDSKQLISWSHTCNTYIWLLLKDITDYMWYMCGLMCTVQLKPTLRLSEYASHWYENQQEKNLVCRYIHQISISRIDTIGQGMSFHILTVIHGYRDLV